jgi:hypothetical protein
MGEVEKTKFFILKDTFNSRFNKQVIKWTDHITSLENFVKEQIYKNNSLMFLFINEYLKVQKKYIVVWKNASMKLILSLASVMQNY